MAFPVGAAIGGVGALLGGIAGAQGNRQSSSTTTRVNLRNVDELNKGEGAQAQAGRDLQMGQFDDLSSLLQRGGTAQIEGDIDQARAESLTLADQLRAAQAGPNEAQMAQAQRFSQDIFAPQQEALNQSFIRSETDTARLAARLGRSVDDPILRARLAESQGNQTAMLQAQQGAFTAQTAQAFQGQQLERQNQLANLRGGLASQALQNRQALLGMGQSLLQQERQFRLSAAGQTQTSTGQSGGGTAGAIGGALAGAGAGLQAFGMFNSFGSSGGQQPPSFVGAPMGNGAKFGVIG